jgi:hypothetical protein
MKPAKEADDMIGRVVRKGQEGIIQSKSFSQDMSDIHQILLVYVILYMGKGWQGHFCVGE